MLETRTIGEKHGQYGKRSAGDAARKEILTKINIILYALYNPRK